MHAEQCMGKGVDDVVRQSKVAWCARPVAWRIHALLLPTGLYALHLDFIGFSSLIFATVMVIGFVLVFITVKTMDEFLQVLYDARLRSHYYRWIQRYLFPGVFLSIIILGSGIDFSADLNVDKWLKLTFFTIIYLIQLYGTNRYVLGLYEEMQSRA